MRGCRIVGNKLTAYSTGCDSVAVVIDSNNCVNGRITYGGTYAKGNGFGTDGYAA